MISTNFVQGRTFNQVRCSPKYTKREERKPANGVGFASVSNILTSKGKKPGGSGAGAGVNSEGDPVVNAEQSNACSLALDQTVVQNGNTEDSSTNAWEG